MEARLIAKIPNEEKIIAAGSMGTRKKKPAYALLNKINSNEITGIDHQIVNKLGHEAISEFSFYI